MKLTLAMSAFLFGTAALAQNQFEGLDLSDDGPKKEEDAPKPAPAPRPSQFDDGPSTPDPKTKDLPLVERDITQDDRVKSVQRKLYLKRGRFELAPSASPSIYLELRPISDSFELEALRVNGLDRERLIREGLDPRQAMTQLAEWVRASAQGGEPVLVAYPISFDWSWLYWYFVRFSATGSPFNHSRCFDMKTAVALLTGVPIHRARRSELPSDLRSDRPHTHNALDDAEEQAEVFRKIMGKWRRT